jgi:hypothetical protein
MEASQVLPNPRFLSLRKSRIGGFDPQNLALTLTRMGGSLAAALRRRFRRDDVVAANYEGCSWGDATERRITSNIVNWGSSRF